jgi:hypothetical protein
MYSPETDKARRCRATTASGAPCRAYAMWRREEGLCSVHAGVPINRRHRNVHVNAKYIPCACGAYAWPHRPAGGRCRWPEPYEENDTEETTP